MEKTKEEGIIGGVERRKLEEALTAKQESEAKLSSFEQKNKDLSAELAALKEKVRYRFGVVYSWRVDNFNGLR